MKKTLILLLGCFICAAVFAEGLELPARQNTVSDYAEVVDAAAKEKVRAFADQLRRNTTVNLKVAVIRSLGPVDVKTFGEQLYQKWDVGQAGRGLDRGVLLLISIIDRQIKIIAGREVAGILIPEIRERIEFTVLASLAEGKFSEAAVVGAVAISQLLQTEWPKRAQKGAGFSWAKASMPLFLLLIVSFLLTFILGGTFITTYGTIIGGLFGYLFFGNVGLVLGAALGFLLNFGGGKE